MSRTLLLITGPKGASEYAARIAEAAGDDLGLVLTAIDFSREKLSGGRIEEDREYGGRQFQTFDEPIFIGSAIAQLAGHAEAVIVDSLDDWAMRLTKRFPGAQVEQDAEVLSLLSVIKARMTELVLITQLPARFASEPSTQRWIETVIERVQPTCDCIIDCSGGAPKALKGSLPV